jgi:FkbM family methyltransferase
MQYPWSSPYARSGEDQWLFNQWPQDFKGFACEIGALDGLHLSNTKLLEDNGWTVLCIEPDPRHWEGLKANRKLALKCACHSWPFIKKAFASRCETAAGFTAPGEPVVWEVPVITLDMALEMVGFERLDALSLDTDGYEEEILKGFDIDRWKPKAVVLEIPPMPPGEEAERHKYMIAHGYEPVGQRTTPDLNQFYLRKS